ncbi:MAG: hypothetical protein ACT4PV_03325 [Planctomycetaceae bacterium]
MQPTTRRRSLGGHFRIDARHKWGTSPTVDVEIEHRNAAVTAFPSAGSFTQITTTGFTPATVTTLKEIIRLKFTVGGGEVDAGWHLFVYAPQWIPG